MTPLAFARVTPPVIVPPGAANIWGFFPFQEPGTIVRKNRFGTGPSGLSAWTVGGAISAGTGKFGNGLFCNTTGSHGVGGTASSSTATSPSPDGWSIAAWVNPTDDDTAQIVARAGGFPNYNMYVQKESTGAGQWQAIVSDGTGPGLRTVSVALGDLGVFHLVIATYDPADKIVRLSIDGAAFSAASALSGSHYVADTSFQVNRSLGLFNGGGGMVIDDLIVWHEYALTAGDVATLWNSGDGVDWSRYRLATS